MRHIAVQELRGAIAVGEVSEDDPDDHYGSSCIVFHFTLARQPLHIESSEQCPLQELAHGFRLFHAE
jgi:hypothetical protein